MNIVACSCLLALIFGCSAERGAAVESEQPAPAQAAPPVSYTTFGEAPSHADAPTVPVKLLMTSPSEYDGKVVRVSGTVAKVCAKKGCWLTLGEPGASGTGAGGPGAEQQTMFVKFTCPIGGRLIPMEAAGKPAIVEGTVTVKTISEAEARHYKEDAGAPPEEIARIVGPQTQVTVASPSAQIAGLSRGTD
jgi:hypothetical protein